MQPPPPQKKTTGNLEYDSLFLLYDEKKYKNYQQIKKNKVDGKYEKTVIEYKKWRILIKSVFGRNITSLSKTELDVFRF